MMSRVRAYLLLTALAFVLTASPGVAVNITLDYNGFNPGTDVTVFKTSTGIGTPIATHAAAVAGDTETTFVFDLTDAAEYAIDLWGNVGSSSTRSSHRISFYFDGTDIDSVNHGGSGPTIKVTGFTPNTTTLTLNTVPLYIDPDGFDPPDDNPDGYIVQGEVGTSGRITLDDTKTFENGGRAVSLVNGIRYMIHYFNDRDSLGQQFVLRSGLVQEEVGLVDEGTTTDASGNESGSTHQLVRLNVTSINIDLNGLSHGVALGDNDYASYPFHNLPAGFNGSTEVLIHTDFGHTGYKFEYTIRLSRPAFDVDASGNIIELNDDRMTTNGNSITFNTTEVEIDVPTETTWHLNTQASPTNPNKSSLGSWTGDQTLTLSPIDDGDGGTYHILGASTTDARNSFRIVYDGPGSYSLTTWSDAGGTTILEDQQSITLFNGTTLTIVPQSTAGEGAVVIIR
jgi:hypothetical protein